MKKWIIGLVLGLCMSAGAQHGVGNKWGNEILLPAPDGSTFYRGFLYKNSAAFSNGKRVIFLNKQDSPKGIYYTYSYDGVQWSTPQKFQPVNVPGINSLKIVVDKSTDILHIVWQRPQPRALYYTQMDSSLSVTVDSVRIDDNPHYGTYNGIYLTIDLQHRLHLMWHEGNTQADDTTECYYSRSTDNGITWSAATLLSQDDDKSSAFPRGQFMATASDTLAIAWRDYVSDSPLDWDIHMVVSEDGGQTWSSPRIINQNSNFQGDPDLVIDPFGRFHMVYHRHPNVNQYETMRIVYGYSDDLGQTWHPSATFNNIISLDARAELAEGTHYQMGTGVLWTFWKDESEENTGGGIDLMCAYSLDRGETWSAPEYVTDLGDKKVGYKAILILPDGTIGINYEVPDYPSTGQMSVFYRERQPEVTAIESPDALTRTFSLLPNFPNPFNPSTWIRYQLPRTQNVQLIIFNLAGHPVRHLVNGQQSAGTHRVQWDGRNDTGALLPTGIYFYQLRAGEQIQTRRMLFLK